MKKFSALLLSLAMLFSLCACGGSAPAVLREASAGGLFPTAAVLTSDAAGGEESHVIVLDSHRAELDGRAVAEYDYTWHCDPGEAHEAVKNAPAEYYTGQKPDSEAAVYIDRELYYFPALPEEGFRQIRYDGETEWAYYYTDGEHGDYIFATLPALGRSLPTEMMHSEEEAAENRVLHITQPGRYVLQGVWAGQIRVELGEDAFTDETTRVTLVLDGADIACTVAPGLLISSAYECDNGWESREEPTADIELSEPGVTVVLADGSRNTVTGTNLSRMLKTVFKTEDSAGDIPVQKKLRKLDGAFYSCVSLVIEGGEKGTGTLEIHSGFEGLDSELHMAVNGGSITVNSRDDGINVNEDDVSVLFLNGGTLTLNAALGEEGDGIDSNGFIVLNGGTLSVNGVTPPDSALDSSCGTVYNGGTLFIDGEEQHYAPGDILSETVMNPGPAPGGFPPEALSRPFDLEDFREKVAALPADATLEDVLALLGMELPGGAPPQRPDGEEPGPGGEEPTERPGDARPGSGAEAGEAPEEDDPAPWDGEAIRSFWSFLWDSWRNWQSRRSEDLI